MRIAAAAIILATLGAGRARAQDVVWSSSAYVAAVLKASPEVRGAREDVTAAGARYRSSFALTYFPTLGLSLTMNPAELDAGGRFTFDSWRFSANDAVLTPSMAWNLFNGFKDVTALRRLRLDRDRTARALEIQLQSRALSAVRAYYGLILRRMLLDVERKNRDAQQEQHRLTQDRYKHGMKSLSDLLKTETDLRSAELDVESAEAERRLALFSFNVLLDRDEGLPADFPDDLVSLSTAVPVLEDGLRHALVHRPEMLRNRLELERADADLRLARLGAYPSLTAAFSYSDSLNMQYGRTRVPLGPASVYGFSLRLALPSSFNGYSQAQDLVAAEATWRNSRNSAEELRRQIRSEVYNAHIGLARALRSYEISLRAEEIAEQNLDLVREQYSQGSADVIRLSQALVDFVNAQSRRMRAFHDANINQAQYRQSVGEPIWH